MQAGTAVISAALASAEKTLMRALGSMGSVHDRIDLSEMFTRMMTMAARQPTAQTRERDSHSQVSPSLSIFDNLPGVA